MNEIEMFFNCARCLGEMPDDVSAAEWARLNVGWTDNGIQVWCVRHDLNVINLTLSGAKVATK